MPNNHVIRPVAPDPSTISATEWCRWLQEQEALIVREYLGRPGRLVSDSNGELNFARDYAGREVLELLQNANDAAAKAGVAGRVWLELTDRGLIAGNTGAVFSRAGVESLLLPHTSPKPAESVPMVGHKGLGFRSVLNWTQTPLILSGNLSLGFSPEIALMHQTQLAELSPAARETIEQQQRHTRRQIVPLLAFPGFRNDGDVGQLLSEGNRELFVRGMALREAGYDSVIVVPFEAKNARAAAEKQIKGLQPEVLLFAGHIGELTVLIDGAKHIDWRYEGKSRGVALVHIGGETPKTLKWKLYRKAGDLPTELLPPERRLGARYEVVLALPMHGQSKPGYLYCYFPTEVSFPYDAVCHATLDLNSNRQHPQANSLANRFVIGELAELMAELAEKLARTSNKHAGLGLLTSHGDDPLEKFDFSSRMFASARSKRLVPVLGGGLARADTARRFHFDDTSWLPSSAFSNVVRVDAQHPYRLTIQKLDVPFFSYDEWDPALAKLEFPNHECRAAFLGGIIKHGLTAYLQKIPVLLDEEGKTVPAGYRVFLPSADQRRIGVPSWYQVRFLHGELTKALAALFARKDLENLADVLAPFGVVRYSLDTLVGGLVAETNRRAHRTSEKEAVIRHELIDALFTLFPNDVAAQDRPRFPRDVTVRLPTQGGTFEDARTLYLSTDFNERGRLLHHLYGSFAPTRLIAGPENLKLEAKPITVAFLLWLGVADVPRVALLSSPDYEFTNYVKSTLPFPIEMSGETFRDVNALGYTHWENLYTIDRLDQVLDQADPVAILAWLAIDQRASEWKSPAVAHGRFGTRHSGQHYPRWYDGPIPSYIRWRIQTKEWLPARNGKKFAPIESLAEAVRGLDALLPVPLRPTKIQFESFGVHSSRIRDALDRAGVIPSFSDIDVDRLYELLLALPKQDPKGAVARAVYRAVLDHFEVAEISGADGPVRFRAAGKMWGRCGNEERYFPIGDLWHVDSEDIPAALMQTLNVVALPKRSGANKVERMFGVSCLTRDIIRRKVTSFQTVYASEAFSDDIEALKPLFLALRRQAKESAEFRRLKIVLCSSISGEMEFQGQVTPLEIAPWGWVFDPETSLAYVQCDISDEDLTTSPLLADTVGQILAAVFRIERGDEFARLVSCRRKDRLSILRRLAGDEGIPEMAVLEREYHESAPLASNEELTLPPASFAPPVIVPVLPQPSAPIVPPAAAPTTAPSAEPIVIDPVDRSPTNPTFVSLQIHRRVSTGPRGLSWSNRVTNADLCEFKAMEFEAKDATPRFPVKVGHVRGWRAPGVDILSFAEEKHRQAFLAGDHREELVARFIEVKGRSSDGAKIDLRNNELAAAQRFLQRYFLYRLYDRGDGTYELAILQNPLSEERGLRHVYEINLEASHRTQEFQISGGVTEHSLAAALAKGFPTP